MPQMIFNSAQSTHNVDRAMSGD